MKLIYNGEQEVPDGLPIQLWTIDAPGHPLDRSTRSIEGLIEEGIIKITTVARGLA